MKILSKLAVGLLAVMLNNVFASSVQDELSLLQDELYKTIQSVDPDSVQTFSALSEAIAVRQEFVQRAGNDYVLVNKKDYTLRAVKNGKEILYDEVIIGTPEQPTPNIDSAYITTIVTNPGWTVSPNTALLRLAPRLAKDPNYASVMGFNIYSSWDPNNTHLVDPKRINWNKLIKNGSIPYKIYQKPGQFNYLDSLKFVIPNTGGIFIHGSPFKSLFKKEKREFSSGCIRMQKTVELADIILENVSAKTISSEIESGKTHFYKVRKPMKVFVVDWPVTFDSETNLLSLK